MQRDFLDRYSRQDSPVHRLPAAAKMAVAATVIGLTVGLPEPPLAYWGATILLLVLACRLGRIPTRYLLERLLWFEPLILAMALAILLQPDGGAKFLLVVAKSTISLLTMVVLANTTPFAEILRVLRHGRLPTLLVTTLALLYRYLFVLADEAERMHRARLARSGTPNRRRLWQQSGRLVGQLFVRSSERADRIYQAMCSRGWQ